MNLLSKMSALVELVSDVGGLIWWVFFRFCKTKLKDEINILKRERNIFVFIISTYILAFLIL